MLLSSFASLCLLLPASALAAEITPNLFPSPKDVFDRVRQAAEIVASTPATATCHERELTDTMHFGGKFGPSYHTSAEYWRRTSCSELMSYKTPEWLGDEDDLLGQEWTPFCTLTYLHLLRGSFATPRALFEEVRTFPGTLDNCKVPGVVEPKPAAAKGLGVRELPKKNKVPPNSVLSKAEQDAIMVDAKAIRAKVTATCCPKEHVRQADCLKLSAVAHELGHACWQVRNGLNIEADRRYENVFIADNKNFWDEKAKKPGPGCVISAEHLRIFRELFKTSGATNEVIDCVHEIAKQSAVRRDGSGPCHGCPAHQLDEAYAMWMQFTETPVPYADEKVAYGICNGSRDQDHPQSSDLLKCFLKAHKARKHLKAMTGCEGPV